MTMMRLQHAEQSGHGQGQPRELPAWIKDDPVFRKHTRIGIKAVLNVIASRCTHQDADGSLIGCEGGKELEQAIGESQSTFWRRIEYLEDHGWLVVVRRESAGGKLPNLYHIPGTPGAIAKPLARLVAVNDRPGDQKHLWEAMGSGAESPPPYSQIDSTPTVKMNGPYPQIDSTPSASHIENASAPARPVPVRPDGFNTGGPEFKKPDEAEPARSGRKRTAPLSIITADNDDLADMASVIELYYDACKRRDTKGRPLASTSEAGRLRFLAIVERARRIAKNPAAMVFSFLTKPDLQKNITCQDEDAARDRLKAWESGGVIHLRQSPEPEPGEPNFPEPTPAAQTTHDEAADAPEVEQAQPQPPKSAPASAAAERQSEEPGELVDAKAFIMAMPAGEREAARVWALSTLSDFFRHMYADADPTQKRALALAIYRARDFCPWTKAADDPAI